MAKDPLDALQELVEKLSDKFNDSILSISVQVSAHDTYIKIIWALLLVLFTGMAGNFFISLQKHEVVLKP